MKLAIIGSRSITDIDISKYIPTGVTMIITGGAMGIDTLAEKYADKHRLSKCIFRPMYGKYPPKQAPLIRNNLIVKGCDEMLAFWDGKSRGTLSTINKAKEAGKPVKVIEITNNM